MPRKTNENKSKQANFIENILKCKPFWVNYDSVALSKCQLILVTNITYTMADTVMKPSYFPADWLKMKKHSYMSCCIFAGNSTVKLVTQHEV